MTVLSGQTIKGLCVFDGMLTPFSERTQYLGMSYGLSVAGYDVRIEFDKDGEREERTISPGEFLLASTIERFRMPNDLIGIVHDKSSWARRGLTVQNTVIEPGWEGWLTLELVNHGRSHITLERGVGIAQVVFHKLDAPCKVSYDGKYNNQERGPVEAK